MSERVDRYTQLLGQLMDGIDRGDFDHVGQLPPQYTYEYLEALFYFADSLDGGQDFYRQMYELVCQAGETAVREKAARGEKIKVTFLAISAAEWPAEDVYRMLEEDPHFEVTVTNCPLTDRDANDRARIYMQNKQFFLERGYRVLDNYSEKQDKVHSWEELNETPDIVIHLTPWYMSLPECYRITGYPCSRVNLYIPYGFGTNGGSNKGNHQYRAGYDKDFYNMLRRAYFNVKFETDHLLLQGRNINFSGYAKMDYFYRQHSFEEGDIRRIWKIPEKAEVNGVKKVIIAPHHSFLGYGGICFSTFAKNAYFWLYLAEKYQNEITFVFKPHPNLRYRAVEAGIFKTAEEYDGYVAKWNAMPNAKVVEEGSYLDVFATSDAMIMDSVSFMAEYLYVNKPLLFLTRPEQTFSGLGRKCLSAFSQADGGDYTGIEKFLTNTVLGGEDSLHEQRRKVFVDELDYVGNNNCLASEFIYRDIKAIIETE